MTDYAYTISVDFTSLDIAGVINLELLRQEVADSGITSGLPLLDVFAAGDTATFSFNGSLTTGDETLLDGVVAAHTGTWPGSDAGEGPEPVYEASATGTTSTTSTTFVQMADMLIENLREGKWAVFFSTTIRMEEDQQFMELGIYVNGTLVPASFRTSEVRHKESAYQFTTQAYVELSDGDDVSIRYRSLEALKFVEAAERSLIMARLG